MNIIQIRGTNGSGKTTMVREFIKKHDSEIITIKEPRQIECTIVDGNILVIGRYDKNQCGGCDASIKTADELRETIAKIQKGINPSILIFEGVMYGKTFSFTIDIYKYSKAIKGDFVAICLESDFETTLERIYERNNGKEVGVKNLESGWKNYIRSNVKLRTSKVPLVTYNVNNMTKEELGEALNKIINDEITGQRFE